MAKRTKPDEIIPVKDPRDADRLLYCAAELRRKLAAIDSAMNAEIDTAKQRAEAKSHVFKTKLAEIERSLQAYAEYNKETLFKKKKSLELMHGIFGFRRSTKLKQLRGIKVADTLEKLKEFGWLDGIRQGKESVNKDALRDWTDEKLQTVGVRRDVSDEFYYEIKEETVEDAA